MVREVFASPDPPERKRISTRVNSYAVGVPDVGVHDNAFAPIRRLVARIMRSSPSEDGRRNAYLIAYPVTSFVQM